MAQMTEALVDAVGSECSCVAQVVLDALGQGDGILDSHFKKFILASLENRL